MVLPPTHPEAQTLHLEIRDDLIAVLDEITHGRRVAEAEDGLERLRTVHSPRLDELSHPSAG